MNPGTQITPDALIERPYPLPDGGTGIDLYIKAEVFREAFAGDLPRRHHRLMQATQRPFSVAAFAEPSGDPGLEDRPVLVPGRHRRPRHPAGDPAVHGGASRIAHGEVAASHVPMMSQPVATTRLITAAADSVS